MESWKIERRKRVCTSCKREFASEEKHISAIREAGEKFERFDSCLPCWGKIAETPETAPFSFWKTAAPKREKKKLEDVPAMIEFFKRLVANRSEEPLRQRITYITALLLMRKRKLKPAGSKRIDGVPHLILEKAWDGDFAEIVDPPIPDGELDTLKAELERLFDLELSAEPVAPVAGALSS